MNPEESVNGNGSWTPTLVLTHLRELIKANDTRYLECFASRERAIATAFTASEKATSAAFSASEKAIRDALAAVEKSTTAAFVASEKAVALAENNAERWREDAKQWRETITERERDLATKTEVSALKERVDRGEGSGKGMRDVWGWVLGIAVALAGFAITIYFSLHK